MNNKISPRRIAFALLPLIVFNLVLILDISVFQNFAWSQSKDPYIWGDNDKLYTNEVSRDIKNGDDLMFSYIGGEADCWDLDKEWERIECYKKNPYGAQGSMVLGGNLVVDNAQALFVNGYDSSGKNWFMTTTTEPYGNALGASRDRNTTLNHGNNVIVDGSVTGGSITFNKAKTSILLDANTCMFINDGLFSDGDSMVITGENRSGDATKFEIYDKGVCGDCIGSCAGLNVGKGYNYSVEGGTVVRGMSKVNGPVRMCDKTNEAPYNISECEHEDNLCCRIPTEYEDEDEVVDDFVGWECDTSVSCQTWDPPLNCDRDDCTYCYPQPYDGEVDPETGERTTSPGTTGGGQGIDDIYCERNGYRFKGDDC